jgi:hypothetical protein
MTDQPLRYTSPQLAHLPTTTDQEDIAVIPVSTAPKLVSDHSHRSRPKHEVWLDQHCNSTHFQVIRQTSTEAISITRIPVHSHVCPRCTRLINWNSRISLVQNLGISASVETTAHLRNKLLILIPVSIDLLCEIVYVLQSSRRTTKRHPPWGSSHYQPGPHSGRSASP